MTDEGSSAGIRRPASRKGVVMKEISEQERSERFKQQRQRICEKYLHISDPRPASSAPGLHHMALISSDVEQTVRFSLNYLDFR